MGGKLEALRGESLQELESDAMAEVKISYSTDTKCFLRAWHLNKTEKALASLGLTCAFIICQNKYCERSEGGAVLV